MARFPWKTAVIGGAILGAGLLALKVFQDKRRLPAPKRVALIGDSYAVGLGPELAKYFPDFKLEGHVGTSTRDWLAHSPKCGRCGDWLATYKPDVVLVSLGVNDGDSLRADDYVRIEQGLNSLRPPPRIVWIEPPANIDNRAQSERVHNALASSGIRPGGLVPATTMPLAAGGLHPQSYQEWAARIAEVVRG